MLNKYSIALLTIFAINSFAFAEKNSKASNMVEDKIKKEIIVIGKTGKEVGKVIGKEFKIIGKNTGKYFKNVRTKLKETEKGETRP